MKVLGFKQQSYSHGRDVRYEEVLVTMSVDELSMITKGAPYLGTDGLTSAPRPDSTFDVHNTWRYLGEVRRQAETIDSAKRILMGLVTVLEHVPAVEEPEPETK